MGWSYQASEKLQEMISIPATHIYGNIDIQSIDTALLIALLFSSVSYAVFPVIKAGTIHQLIGYQVQMVNGLMNYSDVGQFH